MTMTSPIDNEWLKNIVSLGVGVLVGIVLGLFSALFIEPMKFRRLRKIQAAEARDLIYEELGAIFASLKLSIPMGDEACKALITDPARMSETFCWAETSHRHG
jgi:gas vesicle protein